MPGNFSSKKVARAARTGGGRRRVPGSTSYGWYALLAVIVLVGTGLVYVSRADRLDASNPGSTPPLAPSPTRSGDFWYEAYGIYICDKFVPNIDNQADPYGIATKNDGVIHIHPYERKYAGNNATLGLFGKAVGMKIDRDSLEIPNDPKKYGSSEKCGDKPGELVLKEWENAKDESSGKIIESNPKNLKLRNNAAVTIAFVPEGERNIPMPPSAANLEQVAAAAQAALQGGTNTTDTTAPAGETTTTVAPTETTTTTAAPGQ